MPIIIDTKEFLEVNKNCLAFQEGSPRVSVSIHLDGDGICDFLSWIMRYIIPILNTKRDIE